MNKRLVLYVGLAAAVCTAAFSYSPLFAATTATVTATVTVQNISVNVSPGTISWGTLAIGAASSTNPAYTQSVVNKGNVAEDFTIQGQNSANWTIAATPGTDQYTESFCASSCASAPTGFTALTTTNQTLATNVAALATTTADFYLQTPTSSSVYTQQDVSVTITAAAH